MIRRRLSGEGGDESFVRSLALRIGSSEIYLEVYFSHDVIGLFGF